MSDQPKAVTEEQPQVEEPMSPVVDEAPEMTQVVIRKQPKALSQRDPVVIAEHFHRSGFFKDVRSMSQAVVKIIAGEEIGIGPMAAIKGITVIEGTLGYTGNLLATLVKQHDSYDYKVVETTKERCEIEFYEDGLLVGTSEFTIEDAETAELVKPKSNWVKWPKAMCFNRALTQGVRAYIPDVTAGTPAYSDDEIEEVISEEPAAVDAEVVDETPTLDEATVENLMLGFGVAGPHLGGVTPLDGLNVLLGSMGIDGFSPNIEVSAQMAATLTVEQAAQLDAEFQKVADAASAAEEAPDAGA